MKKSEEQLYRQEYISHYLQKEEKQTGELLSENTADLMDEAQLNDVVKLGKKKTWKPNDKQKRENNLIKSSKELTKKATADTLNIYDWFQTNAIGYEWEQVEGDSAYRYLSSIEFTPAMLTSANIRAHFGEYMQIVRCIEAIRKSIKNGDPDGYEARMSDQIPDLDLFYKRMKAYCERNRVHLNGYLLKDDEEPAEFTLSKEEIMKGSAFKHKRSEEYNSGNLEGIDIEAVKRSLLSEEKWGDYTHEERETAISTEKRYYGFKQRLIKTGRVDGANYDTAAARIAEITEMKKQIKFLDEYSKKDGRTKVAVDGEKYRSNEKVVDLYSKFKREKIDLKARLILAEAEARMLIIQDEDNAYVKKVKEAEDALREATEKGEEEKIPKLEAELIEIRNKKVELAKQLEEVKKEIQDAWEDYRAVQIRLAKETMPITSSGKDPDLMTHSKAITSESDKRNYAFKKDMLLAGEGLDENFAGFHELKQKVKMYAEETHYSIGCDAETELLGEIDRLMKAAEKDILTADRGAQEKLRGELDKLYSVRARLDANMNIPNFEEIPEALRMDFSTTRLKENGKFKDSGHVRNAFMNNDLMRKWVDVSDLPIFPHEPTINDLRQGKVSNCYMLAATTSLIQHDPEAIKHIIKDNGDGTATVRLYKGEGQPVFIRIKKEVPRLAATGGAILTSGPLWMQLIEMAAAHVGLFKEGGRTGVGSLWHGPGSLWFGMLTGVFEHENLCDVEKDLPLTMDLDALFNDMMHAKENNIVYHMGTRSNTTAGMNSGHAYTVIGARLINNARYVTLRNPYANMSYQYTINEGEHMSSDFTSSVPDETCGQFDIPFELFVRNANTISKTKVSDDSAFYFPDEKVALRDLVDGNGRAVQAPGTIRQGVQDIADAMDEMDDVEEEIMQEIRTQRTANTTNTGTN